MSQWQQSNSITKTTPSASPPPALRQHVTYPASPRPWSPEQQGFGNPTNGIIKLPAQSPRPRNSQSNLRCQFSPSPPGAMVPAAPGLSDSRIPACVAQPVVGMDSSQQKPYCPTVSLQPAESSHSTVTKLRPGGVLHCIHPPRERTKNVLPTRSPSPLPGLASGKAMSLDSADFPQVSLPTLSRQSARASPQRARSCGAAESTGDDHGHSTPYRDKDARGASAVALPRRRQVSPEALIDRYPGTSAGNLSHEQEMPLSARVACASRQSVLVDSLETPRSQQCSTAQSPSCISGIVDTPMSHKIMASRQPSTIADELCDTTASAGAEVKETDAGSTAASSQRTAATGFPNHSHDGTQAGREENQGTHSTWEMATTESVPSCADAASLASTVVDEAGFLTAFGSLHKDPLTDLESEARCVSPQVCEARKGLRQDSEVCDKVDACESDASEEWLGGSSHASVHGSTSVLSQLALTDSGCGLSASTKCHRPTIRLLSSPDTRLRGTTAAMDSGAAWNCQNQAWKNELHHGSKDGQGLSSALSMSNAKVEQCLRRDNSEMRTALQNLEAHARNLAHEACRLQSRMTSARSQADRIGDGALLADAPEAQSAVQNMLRRVSCAVHRLRLTELRVELCAQLKEERMHIQKDLAIVMSRLEGSTAAPRSSSIP